MLCTMCICFLPSKLKFYILQYYKYRIFILQKCVRQNLGRRTLELIKDSDDWLCFGCNPTQLINLKIICTSLFEFVQEEIR